MNPESLIKQYIELILVNGLGLDTKDPNLSGTPERVAKMYLHELFAGLHEEPPVITTFPNTEGYDEMVLVDNIPFISVCSHHLLPFQGLAWFLYIPGKNIIQEHTSFREETPVTDISIPIQIGSLIGLSKIPRIINHFAARPQLQERLTQQIVEFFVDKVKPLGAMLVMRATHGCMACRGVKTGNRTGMMTSKVVGNFKDNPETRREALDLISISIKLSGA